jgi:hypothetical protein
LRIPFLLLAILAVQFLAACTPNTNASVHTLTPDLSPTSVFPDIPIATETANIIEVQTSSPSPDFIETASINTVISTVESITLITYPSPDGNWRAEVIRYDCTNYRYPDHTAIIAYEQLKLINLKDGAEQIIEDQLQNCDGIGGGGLNGLYWSPNNRYFYYTDWREGNPESCGNYIVPMVYRFDTLTQESLTIGGGHISPDHTKHPPMSQRLATQNVAELVVVDGMRNRIEG